MLYPIAAAAHAPPLGAAYCCTHTRHTPRAASHASAARLRAHHAAPLGQAATPRTRHLGGLPTRPCPSGLQRPELRSFSKGADGEPDTIK
jgi:hypothetical protein